MSSNESKGRFAVPWSEIPKTLIAVGVPAAAGGIGFGIRYCYERGYCDYFGIPPELISLTTADILVAVFAFGLAVFGFFWIVLLVIGILHTVAIGFLSALIMILLFYSPFLFKVWHHELTDMVVTATIVGIVFGGLAAAGWPTAPKAQRWRMSFWLAVLSVVLLFVGCVTDSLFMCIALPVAPLIAFVVFIALQYMFPRTKTESLKEIVADRGFALFLLVAFLPWILSTQVGSNAARGKEVFLVRGAHVNYVLARVYGDTMIFCEFEEGELTGRLQIVSRQDVSNETLAWIDVGPLEKRNDRNQNPLE
jgi:hypothetical protein